MIRFDVVIALQENKFKIKGPKTREQKRSQDLYFSKSKLMKIQFMTLFQLLTTTEVCPGLIWLRMRTRGINMGLSELTFKAYWLRDTPTSLTFNNCTLCPHCIYVFCIYLRTNSDSCHLQHKLIGFYNRDGKCLQRDTNWVFK